ncbi:DUF6838 family protein [Clostridium sp. BL-8]|uniref:phage tail terminator family protein n=1 Tax=Clostridium sp. BL-8 TaxID=349938 RepID=UPI00098C7A1C|nr:hypothetical protein [Clostridium sp. BL-8]OOM80936.1 hypothetical protein CLOBL_05350 [Clostridium sp. BL-8]
MINELINSINEMLAVKFPDTKVYLSKSEKDFSRPSFFIRYVTSRQKDFNRNSYLNVITMKIIYFPELDEFMNADLIAQNEVWDTMREIFSIGYIKVLDRAAKIRKSRGRAKNTEIHLKLKIDYIQDKIFNTPQSPKAEKVNFKF